MAVSPERQFANDLRSMFSRATTPGLGGMPIEAVIRTIVEAAERFADATDAEREQFSSDHVPH